MYQEFAGVGPDLRRANLFLLDEFVLPVGSRGRCDVMLSEGLLDHLSHAPDAVIDWDTEEDLASAGDRMEESIAAVGGLDLALLGLGLNGHVGVNEPGSSGTSRSRVVDLTEATADGAIDYGATVKPQQGLTMGIGTLLDAAEIWLLVTGSRKAEMLARAIAGPIGSEVPASFLQGHRNATVMADESAASLL